MSNIISVSTSNNALESRFVGQGEEGLGVEPVAAGEGALPAADAVPLEIFQLGGVQIRRHQHVVLAPHQGHTSVVPARVSQTREHILRKQASPEDQIRSRPFAQFNPACRRRASLREAEHPDVRRQRTEPLFHVPDQMVQVADIVGDLGLTILPRHPAGTNLVTVPSLRVGVEIET